MELFSSYKFRFCLLSSILITWAFLSHDDPSSYQYLSLHGSGNGSKCQIPRLDPFQSEAMEYLKKPAINETVRCAGHIPLLFKSEVTPRFDSFIVPAISEGDFVRKGIDSCCYRVVTARPKNRYHLSSACTPLSLREATKIPDDCEFAAVYCTLSGRSPEVMYPHFQDRKPNESIFVDLHFFVPLKPEVEKRLKPMSLPPPEGRLNVLIIGTDAVSRNHLIRAMPQTYKFLVEELGAVDMKGYNKVGENTFPSMIPLLLSMTKEETLKGCAYWRRFDSCPFIWDAFAERGYRTSFHEDMPMVSMFSSNDRSRMGFDGIQPTDYYSIAPMLLAYRKGKGSYACVGPRLTNTLLQEYTQRFVTRMDHESKAYFHYMWSSALTHDLLQDAKAQDAPLTNLLKWLRNEGHLINTALVVLSDHGNNFVYEGYAGLTRWSLEGHLPFMFFVLPKWFQRNYPKAYRNLQENSNYYLTTAFDLHQTLLDILEPARLQSDQLYRRELEVKKQTWKNSLPRGISQFLPIPETRTCDDAGIPTRHCVCLGTWEDVSVRNREVLESAEYTVHQINVLLNSTEPANSCSRLKLSKLLSAKQNIVGGQKPGMEIENAKVSYLIQFETEPGEALFEAQVLTFEKNFTIANQITRLDRYSAKGHGDCVKGRNIEKYCYCMKMRQKV